MRVKIIDANDTSDTVFPAKGVYLMTDIYGNQRKVKIVPAEKSILFELLEPAPKLKTNDNYDTFLYKKGFCRLKYGDLSPLYCFSSTSYKFYPQNGSEPLYFEFENKIK